MIQPKLKPCKTCLELVYLFSHGNCKDCSTRLKIAYNKGITPLTVKKVPVKPLKRSQKPIKKVSGKQLDKLKKYRKERDAHFKEFPVCQFPNCTSTDITLHHGAGKVGALLTNRKYFKSLCLQHHTWAEINPLEAQELELSFKRLDK